jgi:hypothetical protein
MFQPTARPKRHGAAAAIAVGVAVAVSSFGIVRADLANPDKTSTFKCTTGKACVIAKAKGSPYGVEGISSGSGGILGIGTGSSGEGVYGSDISSVGVLGESSYNTGVRGESFDSYGIVGESKNGIGIIAESSATASNTIALESEGTASSTNLFEAENTANNSDCLIDAFADLSCTGEIGAVRRNSGGERVVAYASESATATIEDVGTARMAGGVADVRIDPAFAAVMDHQWYYVLVTPLGDTRGLYVSLKTSVGFVVRENEHGRDNVAFDYRIVAHPLDASSARLPAARRP